MAAGENGKKTPQDLIYEQSCPCADRRYQRVTPHMLIDSKLGEWVYLGGLTITAAKETTNGD
jgi:hypothetical protein